MMNDCFSRSVFPDSLGSLLGSHNDIERNRHDDVMLPTLPLAAIPKNIFPWCDVHNVLFHTVMLHERLLFPNRI